MSRNMDGQVKRKIIIAEDSASIREAIAFGLEEAGYDVEKAENGLDAFKKFNGSKIDLLLTDFHMPEMNGVELIKNVRSITAYRNIPIVVLTTENQKELILQAKQAGGTGWLAKPFSMEKLVQIIRRLIR